MAIILNSSKNVRRNVYRHKNNVIENKSNLFDKINKLSISNIFKNINFNIKFNNTIFIKSCISIILALFIFITFGYGIKKIYELTTNLEYFKISSIELKNNKILSNEEIISITNLEEGSNIFDYDINDIRIKLLKNAWIDDVIVSRNLPNKFSIIVQEKEPIFWVVQNEKLYYLDKNLNYIAPVTKEKYFTLPTFQMKEIDQVAINNINLFIDELNNANLPFDINDLTWFSINPLTGYEFYLEELNLNISVSIHNFEQGIQNLTLVLDDLKKRKEINKIKNIIVAFNQVTIEKN